MIRDMPEILIVAFDRCSFLDKILKRLKESPFSKCKITPLDKCSADDTPEVCKRYREAFPNFSIVRNKKISAAMQIIYGQSNYRIPSPVQ